MAEEKKQAKRVRRIPLKERLDHKVTMFDLEWLMLTLMSDLCEGAAMLTGDGRYLEFYRREILPMERELGIYFDLVRFMNYCKDTEQNDGMLVKKTLLKVMRYVGELNDLKNNDPKLYEKVKTQNYFAYLDKKGGKSR